MNRQYRQQQTTWQRFWSSPWTWTALAIFFIWNVNFRNLGWNANTVNLVFAIWCWNRFFHYADKRWGKTR